MNKEMICNYCFDDEKLNEWIEENGEKVNNDYICPNCNIYAKEVDKMYILDKKDLVEKLKDIILSLYENDIDLGMYHFAEKNLCDNGDDPNKYAGLISLEEICGDLFGNEELAEMISENISWKDIADGGNDYFSDIDSPLWKDKCWWEDDEFQLTQWETFCENVKHKARYFGHKDFSVIKFLEEFKKLFLLLEFSDDLVIYRARKIASLNEELRIKSNLACELGKVPIQFAKNNRFSPIGISYGYFSLDKQTAIKEIRAKEKEKIAIGKFYITKELKLIDFRKKSMEKKINIFNNELNVSLYCQQQFIKEFLDDISKPVNENDILLEYIPTQIMSEYIWHVGIDGFLYDSSQNKEGVNLVIFENRYFFKNYEIIKL